MKKIFLIRHAESEANAGGVFEFSNIVRLTDTGKQQAVELIGKLSKPDRIIVSKYIRTQETAEPLIKKLEEEEHFFDVSLWHDIHEFSALDFHKITTKNHEGVKERARWYWGKNDPEYRDAEHKETFKEFAKRTHKALKRMRDIDKENYIFTHGLFIRLFKILTEKYSNSIFEKNKDDPSFYKKLMTEFDEYFLNKDLSEVKNTEILDATEMVEKYFK
jgi:broad specificity phosphatase PhoE